MDCSVVMRKHFACLCHHVVMGKQYNQSINQFIDILAAWEPDSSQI